MQLQTFAELEAVRAAKKADGFATRVIIIEPGDDQRTAMRLLEHAFQFPVWFGMNWDAVDDLLIDPEWIEATVPGAVLVAVPEQETSLLVERLRSSFGFAAPYWRERGFDIEVIFVELPVAAYTDT